MSKIYLLFNCPSDQNDKKWLEDILNEHAYNYEIIETKLYANVMAQKNIRGKFLYYTRIFSQAVRAILRSGRGDMIISWSGFTAGFINILSIILGNRRKIISMNWLTPCKKRFYWEWLDKKQFTNKNVMITVNSLESRKKYMDRFNLDNGDNIYFIPDIYDTTVDFTDPKDIIRQEKYIFTGGMANRDWKLVITIAQKLPELRFVCCAQEHDFKSKVKDVPDNVDVYFSIPSDKYYALMKNAYVILLPLIEDNVSGLINITHSAQHGIPCLTGEFEFTKMYYPEKLSNWLIAGNDENIWIQEIEKIFEVKRETYIEKASLFQNYVKDNFGPKTAFNILKGMLNKV